ncbi:MAG: methyl-accepting chemotaxis protein [Breznakibacter sp.]
MQLKNLQTRTKLMLGFGSVLMLTLIVASIGIGGIGRYSDISTNVHQMSWADAYFIDARLSSRNYVMLRNIADYEKSVMMADSAKMQLDAFITNAPSDEDRKQGIKLKEEIDQYLQELQETRALVEQEVLLLDQMKGIMNQMHQQHLNASLQFAAMSAQVNVLRSKVFDDIALLDEAKTAIQRLEKLSSGELYQLAGQYEKAIDEYRVLAPDLVKKQQNLRTLGHDIEAELAHESDLLGIQAQKTKNAASWSVVVISLLALVIGTVISLTITRYFNTSFKRTTLLAQNYAAGDLTDQVEEKFLVLKDEIGDMARALMGMRNKFTEVLSGVLVGAENVSSASVQSSTASQQMTEGSNEQASSVEEISSTMEEISANIQQNTENALLTKQISQNVANAINLVGSSASQSVTSMRLINEKIQVINDIAMQTNILALNAAVEAARAGEHGRGFAVVAAEVRKLAENSRQAADEIVNLTENSLGITEKAAGQLSSVIEDIEQTNAMVQEIAAASSEQSNGVLQVNEAIQELNRITQQNAAASEELASSSEELAGQAEQLKEMIAYFRVK